MQTAVTTMTISMPISDVRMAKNLIGRMGWTVSSPRKRRKTSLELAIEDDLAGRVTHYSSLEELKAKFAHV